MKNSAAAILASSFLLCVTLTGCSKESAGGTSGAGGARAVDIDFAFSREDYKTAIPLLRERLKKDPKNAGDWFRLGYALHSVGELKEAVEAHAKAAGFGGVQKPIALYNWGCALALLGQKDEAIARIEEAIAAGFDRKRTVMDDPELDSLRSDERFVKLIKSMEPPAGSDQIISEHTNLDFWVGDWDLRNEDGRRVARCTITSEQNGYVLREVYRASNRASSSSMTFFDPGDKTWKQNRISSDGRIVYYTGEFRDNAMRLEGQFVGQDGKRGLRRSTLQPDPDEGTVEWVLTESLDDGENWTVLVRGTLVARKPRLTR